MPIPLLSKLHQVLPGIHVLNNISQPIPTQLLGLNISISDRNDFFADDAFV